MDTRRTCIAVTAALLLLPISVAAQTLQAAATEPPAVRPVEQQPLLIGIRLNQRPIASLKEARIYAGEWIRAGGLNEVAIGRVQRVGGLFIADLVMPESPRKLQNQLLVRSRDGLGTLVYPANLNRPVPPEMASGMAGLEGMAGMGGLRTTIQRNTPIGGGGAISVRNARRAVDSWLLGNGLRDLYAGTTRDLGGIFVSDVVDRRGLRMNQAVLRKADGYIQMSTPAESLAKLAESRGHAAR